MNKNKYIKPKLEIFKFHKSNILTKFSTDAEVDDFNTENSLDLNFPL